MMIRETDRKLLKLALKRKRIDVAMMIAGELTHIAEDKDNLAGATQEAITGVPGDRLRALLWEAVNEWIAEEQWALARRAEEISGALETTRETVAIAGGG